MRFANLICRQHGALLPEVGKTHLAPLSADADADSGPGESRADRSRWRSDLWVVAAVTVASFLVAAWLELHEALAQRLSRLERWQVDEIPLSLTVLAFGLVWYALRRRREVTTQLALRAQAERRVAELLARNRELARRLISAQESERLALARELHDELGQSCTAIRIETACLRHCAADDRPAIMAAAERTDEAARGLYELVRGMLRRLRPANLDSLGLAAALQELCESWAARTGICCSFDAQGPSDGLGDDVEIAIFRVAQEALTNAARHARASNVRVTLARPVSGPIRLTVRDDGQGMDVGAATRGLGLLGARERAAAVGGTLEVQSVPGAGLTIALEVPDVLAARATPDGEAAPEATHAAEAPA